MRRSSQSVLYLFKIHTASLSAKTCKQQFNNIEGQISNLNMWNGIV